MENCDSRKVEELNNVCKMKLIVKIMMVVITTWLACCLHSIDVAKQTICGWGER